MFIRLWMSQWEFQRNTNAYRHVTSHTPEVPPSNSLSCVMNPLRNQDEGRRKRWESPAAGARVSAHTGAAGKELEIEANPLNQTKEKEQRNGVLSFLCVLPFLYALPRCTAEILTWETKQSPLEHRAKQIHTQHERRADKRLNARWSGWIIWPH